MFDLGRAFFEQIFAPPLLIQKGHALEFPRGRRLRGPRLLLLAFEGVLFFLEVGKLVAELIDLSPKRLPGLLQGRIVFGARGGRHAGELDMDVNFERPDLHASAVAQFAHRAGFAVDEDAGRGSEFPERDAGGMAGEQAEDRGSVAGDAQIAARDAADEEIDVAERIAGRASAALTHLELHVGQQLGPVGGRDNLG